jgi:tRNA-(ms[2]io[6]A)-hydroxylase
MLEQGVDVRVLLIADQVVTALFHDFVHLAAEELEHFQQVYEVMEQRGYDLIGDEQDPYVNALLKHCRHGRDERFLDRLLVSGIVENRGAERFRLVSEYMAGRDEEMRVFYRDLWASEARHANLFVDLALEYFGYDEVYARLEELTRAEAEIVEALPWRASLH